MNSSASFNFDDASEDEGGNKMLQSYLPGLSSGDRSPALMKKNPLDIVLTAYLDHLEKNPLVTKSITCAIVSALGALLGNMLGVPQQVQPQNKPRNSKSNQLQKLSEVAAFALYGGLVGGPLAHWWNQWLAHHFTKQQLSTSWSLLVDQLIAQPPMLFLMHLVLDMAGAAIQEIPHAINRSWERTGHSLVMSWRFWPVAAYIV